MHIRADRRGPATVGDRPECPPLRRSAPEIGRASADQRPRGGLQRCRRRRNRAVGGRRAGLFRLVVRVPEQRLDVMAQQLREGMRPGDDDERDRGCASHQDDAVSSGHSRAGACARDLEQRPRGLGDLRVAAEHLAVGTQRDRTAYIGRELAQMAQRERRRQNGRHA